MANHAGYVTVVDHYVFIVISVRYFTSNSVSVILFLEFTIRFVYCSNHAEKEIQTDVFQRHL